MRDREVFLHIESLEKKLLILKDVLEALATSKVIIFYKDLDFIDQVKAAGFDIPCEFISRDFEAQENEESLKRFHDADHSYLFVSNLASKSFRMDDCFCLINYDLPIDPKLYLIRQEFATQMVSFYCVGDEDKLRHIEVLLEKRFTLHNMKMFINRLNQS